MVWPGPRCLPDLQTPPAGAHPGWEMRSTPWPENADLPLRTGRGVCRPEPTAKRQIFPWEERVCRGRYRTSKSAYGCGVGQAQPLKKWETHKWGPGRPLLRSGGSDAPRSTAAAKRTARDRPSAQKQPFVSRSAAPD